MICMVTYNLEQQSVISALQKGENPHYLKQFKCSDCSVIFTESQSPSGTCPVCHISTHVKVMCPVDTPTCSHQITSGVEWCPACNSPVCPTCGCHEVSQISRVTGYLSNVGSWCAAKQQELKDRVRHNQLI